MRWCLYFDTSLQQWVVGLRPVNAVDLTASIICVDLASAVRELSRRVESPVIQVPVGTVGAATN